MLVKLGVYYNKLKRPIRRAMNIVDQVFIDMTGREAVLTSTNEGDHSPSSLHYDNLAMDFRMKDIPFEKRDSIRLEVRKRLRDQFGALKYDVVFSEYDTALHVEYDPKG